MLLHFSYKIVVKAVCSSFVQINIALTRCIIIFGSLFLLKEKIGLNGSPCCLNVCRLPTFEPINFRENCYASGDHFLEFKR